MFKEIIIEKKDMQGIIMNEIDLWFFMKEIDKFIERYKVNIK